MKKLETPLKDDLKDLTSANNFIVGLVFPVITNFIFNKENTLKSTLLILGILLLIILVWVFFRWLFFHRKTKEKKKTKRR